MKKQFLLIFVVVLTIFIIGCSREKVGFDSEMPTNYIKTEGNYSGYTSINGINYVFINDLQLKASSTDIELIKMGTEAFKLEIIYKINNDEYELIDYRFIKKDGTIFTTKDKTELNNLILQEIDYPENGIYEGNFTIVTVGSLGYGLSDDEQYTYIDMKVTSQDGKEIKFRAKSNETENYKNIKNLNIGQKVHFIYNAERDNTFGPYDVNYTIISFK